MAVHPARSRSGCGTLCKWTSAIRTRGARRSTSGSFRLSSGDAIFPPIPSEMVLITGGALSAEGRANLFLVGLLSATASWLGDVVVFQLFKRRLSHILDRWAWGRKIHRGIHEAIAKAGRSSDLRHHHRGPVHPGRAARDVRSGRHRRRLHPGLQPVRRAGSGAVGDVARGPRLLHGLRNGAAFLGEFADRCGRRPGDWRRRGSDRHAPARRPLPRGRAGRCPRSGQLRSGAN